MLLVFKTIGNWSFWALIVKKTKPILCWMQREYSSSVISAFNNVKAFQVDVSFHHLVKRFTSLPPIWTLLICKQTYVLAL